MFDRRSFLITTASTIACTALPRWSVAESAVQQARHLPAIRSEATLRHMGDYKRRASFGWEVAGIPPVNDASHPSVELEWDQGTAVSNRPARLRLCVLDTREPKTPVEVRLRNFETVLGTFDLQWVAQFQVFEISLTAEQAAAVVREGIQLRQTAGELPVWILTGTGTGPEMPDALKPHLLFEQKTDPDAEFFLRMNSLACVQPFGWMDGCVLDGLRDLAAISKYHYLQKSLNEHLNLWFKPDGEFLYENPRGEPVDNKTNGQESTLPFAVLAWERPEHPALKVAVRFLSKEKDPAKHPISTTSEGAYTVAYPLAAAARQLNDPKLAAHAYDLVMGRQQRLFDGKILSRTSGYNKSGKLSFGNRNWCRGVAWQFLGLVRTLMALEGIVDTSAGKEAVRQTAEWIIPYQLPNGLWSVFVHEPELTPDTSGSAGIAAALALAANHGWADSNARASSGKCLEGLKPHLTPDGFLGGASQSNKGGEGLQRGDYRVIYQMGMGLMAQLIAATESR
ncbi:MAG TPA: glycoside hydrolase family 88 protein [Planctomicrobium sp.]|nr:glycoside hydrolase family 88 protein [Planctomicrobium sp.]